MPKAPDPKPRFRYRLWLTVAACVVAFASTAWAARTVRGFLSADPRFILRAPLSGRRNDAITVIGVKNTALASVQQVFVPDYGHSVYQIPIAERRRRLLAVDWIEDATVSRIWPNRLQVRIRERRPVAYLAVPHRAFLLIDADGVLLSPPPRSSFEFPVLHGVAVEQSEPERKLRVQATLRLLEDLGPASKDISEVNAASPEDLRVTTGVEGRAVELWLGDGNFAQRYRNFMDHYADIRAGSPRAGVFDLRIDDRITAK